LSNAIEIVAVTATRFARTSRPDARRSAVGRWCDGVAVIREQRLMFAEYWRTQNEAPQDIDDPVWVVLGDSTALGLGADHPLEGYAGQTQARLARRTGRPWRIINLGVSGAQTADVMREQLPRLAALRFTPDLVTCGVGANDILHTPPARLRTTLETLIRALPRGTTILDLPVPEGCWGVGGRPLARYISQVNRTIHTAARHRALPVAEISTRFKAPWSGMFGPDGFHPSTLGYSAWTAALLDAL